MPCVWGELQRFLLSVSLTLVQPSMLAQTCSNKSDASTQQEWRNHLFYGFPALPSRITLLTLASCFLIGLAIDCPPSSLLPSRWPITNKHSLLEVHSNPKKNMPPYQPLHVCGCSLYVYPIELLLNCRDTFHITGQTKTDRFIIVCAGNIIIFQVLGFFREAKQL